jgi:arsenical pump membrane protein
MASITIWIISLISIGAVIIRPYRIPEAVWAVSGALLLLALRLLSPSDELRGIGKGMDVYLFLTGMMLLAETAREEKLFDWLAAHATRRAKGSPGRLFLLIYAVGTVVTVFLSNDATAVVLTPAVAAAMRVAKVERPLPYLLICAFIANAASFVLPISNPANLVIYGSHMPPLLLWLLQYTIPSVLSIATTFLVLRWTQRKKLRQEITTDIPQPPLSSGGKLALWGIGGTGVALLVASGLDLQLGLPTAITGILTTTIVLILTKKSPWMVIKGVSWSVIPLVAGLFVIVEALGKTGLIGTLAAWLQHSIGQSPTGAAWASGTSVAVASNLMNNLPVGLISGQVLQTGQVPEMVKRAVLIGVDLGPNLSITGSLATILWLVALRREGQAVSARSFLKIGALVMTTALAATLAAVWLT